MKPLSYLIGLAAIGFLIWLALPATDPSSSANFEHTEQTPNAEVETSAARMEETNQAGAVRLPSEKTVGVDEVNAASADDAPLPNRMFSGRVLHRKMAVENAIVYVYSKSGAKWNPASEADRKEARETVEVNSDGSFQFQTDASECYLVAVAPGFLPRESLHVLDGAALEMEDIELNVYPAKRLWGRVEYNKNPVPTTDVIAGISYTGMYSRPAKHPETEYRILADIKFQTDGAGEFSASVPDSEFILSVSHPKYRSSNRGVHLRDCPVVLELWLPKESGFNLLGTVMDPSNRPVPAAKVVFLPKGPSVTTDENGDFELRNLKKPNRNSIQPEIVAWGNGFAPAHLVLPKWSTKMDPVIITLGEDHSISGSLVDQEGNAIPDALIRIYGERSYPSNSTMEKSLFTFFKTPSQAKSLKYSQTDGDGKFDFFHLPRGEYQISFHGLQDSHRAPAGTSLAITKAAVGDQNVQLRVGSLGPDAITVQGIVRDKLTGKPIPGARVSLMKTTHGYSAMGIAACNTDENGRFEFPGLQAVEFHLSCSADGYAKASTKRKIYAPGTHDESVSLYPARRLELTVLDAVGNPVEGARVYLANQDGESIQIGTGKGGSSSSVQTDEFGKVIMIALPAKEIVVKVATKWKQPMGLIDFDLRGPGPHSLIYRSDLLHVESTFEFSLEIEAGDIDLAAVANRRDRPLLVTVFNVQGQAISKGKLWHAEDGWRRLNMRNVPNPSPSPILTLETIRDGGSIEVNCPGLPIQSMPFIPQGRSFNRLETVLFPLDS